MISKKTSMNLFELYDYIEALEIRIKRLERLIVKEKEEEKEKFETKPPFYYDKLRNER
tara:strand:+ start:205 stop:378 length:174 start_codon:yes stop_codon:yes gene_type:complete